MPLSILSVYIDCPIPSLSLNHVNAFPETAHIIFSADVWNGFHYTPMSKLLYPDRMLDLACLQLVYLRWIVLPAWTTGSLWTLLNTIPMWVVLGFYLSFFFSLSHQFEVHMKHFFHCSI